MNNYFQPDNPPRWLDHFLEWYCAESLIDEIQGDLYEGFRERQTRLGNVRANWWYFINVLRFFRFSSFGKRDTQNKTTMIHANYFKIALRTFSKHRSFAAINLLGLVLGTTSCLLIALHVLEEVSYDNFHPYTNDTYRVTMDMYNNGALSAKSAPVYPAVGPGLLEDFPEVIDYVRVLPFGDGVYSVKKEDGSLVRFNEDNAIFADENFFELMGFDLVKGNPEMVLDEPWQTVLSESAAKRYFGNTDPIGKTIIYRGRRESVVTGVMKDFPHNSHMQFDIITSVKSWPGNEEWPQNWGWYDFYTFVRLQEGTNLSNLKQKVEIYLDEKKAEDYAQESSREVLKMRNIADIHLNAKGLSWDMGENGGADRVYFLSAIAAIILIIAWVNFINLTTARSVKRAREVGIRKVVGAQRSQLITQFLIEAFLFNLLAVVISVLLVVILIPLLNVVLSTSLDRMLLLTMDVTLALIALIVLGSLISGVYPAVVLSTFRPIRVLKGSILVQKSKIGFRQVLVACQFIASIVLILGTVVVVKQLRYMQSQDLGLNIDQTMVLQAPTASRGEGDLAERVKVFSNEIVQLSSVKGFTMSNVVPGVENFSISSFNTRAQPNVNRDCYRVRVDENYFDQFDIERLAGRNFIKDLASDSNAVLLNQTAVRLFGFESNEAALGEYLNPNSRWKWKVIGVVEDYHHSSLKESLDPIMFYYSPENGNYYSLKVDGENVLATVKEVEAVWEKVYPDNPYDFFFLDEHFEQQYRSDQQFNTVFIGFASLAIIVACLGLFGLVSFNVEQTRKQIGIRKVLGASIGRLMLLLSKEYAVLLLIAMIAAFPLGYYLIKNWLADFAYQTRIDPWIFIFGAILITLITFATVSVKSLTAANANPVDSLRDE